MPSTTCIPIPATAITRFRMTNTVIDAPRLSWDSHKKAYSYKLHDDDNDLHHSWLAIKSIQDFS